MERMEVKTISNFKEFIDATNDDDMWYYRGHADGVNWKLTPTLGRLGNEYPNVFKRMPDWATLEEEIVETFKHRATPYLNNNEPQNGVDWLALAQHYNVPTRLLDFTTSPLVALFFALFEETDYESCVWAISPGTHWRWEIPLHKYSINFEMLLPKHFDKRIANQKSCFCVQGLPEGKEEFLAIEDLDHERLEDYGLLLRKIIIPNDKEIKKELRRRLCQMGITYDLLFPDLAGLGKQIDFQYKNEIYSFG